MAYKKVHSIDKYLKVYYNSIYNCIWDKRNVKKVYLN